MNEFYYPGDGANLKKTKHFSIKPIDFEERIEKALYPDKCSEMLKNQYNEIVSLIDDVLALVDKAEV